MVTCDIETEEISVTVTGGSGFSANVMGEIAHGSTAGTSRPVGFSVVTWVGSVEPDNAVNNDIWVDTT